MNSADIIDVTDLGVRPPITHKGRQNSNLNLQSVTNKNAEVIDLTISPARAYNSNDPDTVDAIPASQSLVIQHKNKSGRRSKKRKKAETGGSDLSSALQTREHSVADESELASQTPSKTPNRGATRGAQHQTQRSQKKKQLSRTPSPSSKNSLPSDVFEGLFFIDLQPSQLQSPIIFSTPHPLQEKIDDPLLLPSHVSILGSGSVEIPASTTTEFDEDYIDYLDIDDSNKNMVRYFEIPPNETIKPAKFLCKHCGAEGEHSTASCPVLICLTCGARNEHSTRSCPISKTCYTCGMKGHINATCPNRRAAKRGEMDRYDDCGRCGSELHRTNECPTLWRLYDYFTEENRKNALHMREQRRRLSLGQGGEGYIADDEWCYNCAGYGHWGDDCQDRPHRDDIPNESSAFSEHNTLSGPFFDTILDRAPSRSRRRQNSDKDLPRELLESWGKVPDNVGRKGRMDSSARMRKKARDMAAEDDPDDWFGKQKSVPNRNMPQRNGKPMTNTPKKLAFGSSIQEIRNIRPHSPPSLLQRIGERYDDGEPGKSRDSQFPSNYKRGVPWESDRQLRREPDKRRRNDSGPRYRGGYLR